MLGALPVLDDGSRLELRLRDLLPADRLLAVATHDQARELDELDVLVVRRRESLVAADVDVLAGRELRELADHVVHELADARARQVERAEADVGAGVRLRLVARGRELRIRDQRRVHVAGQVDLGHDDDTALRRVLDDRRVVALRVRAARPAADRGRAADLRQPRPRLDLDPPALVVGEVQVQPVEAEARDHVDEALHVLDAEEVPRDVEHHAAPLEARDFVALSH